MLFYTTTMNNTECTKCPVATGTHKPAEAVHQIGEPQPDALRAALMMELMSKDSNMGHEIDIRRQHCREAAAELRRQHARIVELEKENSYLNDACAELEAQLVAVQQGEQP